MVQKGREEKEKRPPLLLTSVQKENKEKQGHKKKTKTKLGWHKKENQAHLH